jgi:hypothetical protein
MYSSVDVCHVPRRKLLKSNDCEHVCTTLPVLSRPYESESSTYFGFRELRAGKI